MSKKLYISLIFFSNLVAIKILSSNHRMYNLYTKFVKILERCKQFSENLVNESGGGRFATCICKSEKRKA